MKYKSWMREKKNKKQNLRPSLALPQKFRLPSFRQKVVQYNTTQQLPFWPPIIFMQSYSHQHLDRMQKFFVEQSSLETCFISQVSHTNLSWLTMTSTSIYPCCICLTILQSKSLSVCHTSKATLLGTTSCIFTTQEQFPLGSWKEKSRGWHTRMLCRM